MLFVLVDKVAHSLIFFAISFVHLIMQEWEATANRACIKCEKPHLKSEWDALGKTEWKDKARSICATCRPRPKKPNRPVAYISRAWAQCDKRDLWRILKDTPTSETWHCVDANRQCGTWWGRRYGVVAVYT